MSSKVSDEELDRLDGLAAQLQAESTRAIIAELRELRALLNTPCEWAEVYALAPGDSNGTHTVGYHAVLHGGVTYAPDKAIALGAALVRAGLAARGDK